MATLVVTPIREEFDCLARVFAKRWGSPEKRAAGRADVHVYACAGVTMARGGLGKVQFAVTTGHLLDRLPQVDLLVCAGVAGSLADHVRVGDVVVGTATVEHDFNPKFTGAWLPSFDGSPPHVAALQRMAGDLQAPFRVHFAPVASGDEAIVDADRAAALRARTGALAVAWEGAGGARAASFSDVPYVEVRGISDMADHAAMDVFKANIPSAMENIAVIVAWLAEHPVPA